jgi:MoaA/NifB/PqqE/SkfB family radical SAM enzyme
LRVETLVEEALRHVDPSDRYLTNIFLNEREIAQGRTVIETRPRSLTVSLTSRCNLDCIMCEAKRLSWEMPEKTLREVIGCFP